MQSTHTTSPVTASYFCAKPAAQTHALDVVLNTAFGSLHWHVLDVVAGGAMEQSKLPAVGMLATS